MTPNPNPKNNSGCERVWGRAGNLGTSSTGTAAAQRAIPDLPCPWLGHKTWTRVPVLGLIPLGFLSQAGLSGRAGVLRHLTRAGSSLRGFALFILQLQRWERKINPLSPNKSGELGQVGTETHTVLVLFPPPPRGLSSSNSSPSSGMGHGAARAGLWDPAMGWGLDGECGTPNPPQ